MLKRAAERLLARGLTPLLSRLDRGHVLVLAYHNVIPDGAAPGGDRSLHLPRRAFADQLDALVETHRVISMREALDALGRPDGVPPPDGADPPRRPRAVVTFDDAYRGAMTCGLDELARRGLPATVFVSPGLLGGNGFWWDRLPPGGDAADGEEPPDAVPSPAHAWSREALLRDLAGRGREILGRARTEGRPVAAPPEHALPVTEGELREAASRPGVTFGAHGWSHANLARLEGDELDEELARPRAWLDEELGDAFLPVLAYPYGRSSGAASEAAEEAGYKAAFTVAGGSFDPAGAPDPFQLPRTNIPAGVSVDGFRLRTLGLLA